MAKDEQPFIDQPETGNSTALSAQLFGNFRILDPDGQNIAPKGSKACAMIALCLLAPNSQRPRAYLASMLWSDRAQPQALGSLRSAINETRNAFGSYADCLLVDRETFGFHPGTIATDLNTAAHDRAHLFLEDIRVPDPEFRDWMLRLRGQFGTRSELLQSPLVQIQSSGTADPIQMDALNHGIANGIGDWCAMRIATVPDSNVQDLQNAPERYADYVVQTRLNQMESGVVANVALTEKNPSLSRWSMATQLKTSGANLLTDEALFKLINNVADRVISDLAPVHKDTSTSRFLTAGTLGAVRCIFRNDPGDLEAASRQLWENFDVHRDGVYLAWLAYLTTFEVAERNALDTQAIAERAQSLCAQALELDPYGSMTLALCSYVQSFVLKDRATGFDLATRAIESNRANPMAWIFRGAANFFEGNGENATKDTHFARNISGYGPYSYVVDTFCCAAATCAGQLDDALFFAEKAAAKSPNYKAPLRYIVAIHASRGDIDALRLAIRRLRRIEPNFTIDSLREKQYPVPGLRAAGLAFPD